MKKGTLVLKGNPKLNRTKKFSLYEHGEEEDGYITYSIKKEGTDRVEYCYFAKGFPASFVFSCMVQDFIRNERRK